MQKYRETRATNFGNYKKKTWLFQIWKLRNRFYSNLYKNILLEKLNGHYHGSFHVPKICTSHEPVAARYSLLDFAYLIQL